MAGNAATKDGAQSLITGADAIKVGMALVYLYHPCRGRCRQVLQLTAIMTVESEKADVPVIADGGIKYCRPRQSDGRWRCCVWSAAFGGTTESLGEVFSIKAEATKPIAAWACLSDGARSADRYFQQDIEMQSGTGRY